MLVLMDVVVQQEAHNHTMTSYLPPTSTANCVATGTFSGQSMRSSGSLMLTRVGGYWATGASSDRQTLQMRKRRRTKEPSSFGVAFPSRTAANVRRMNGVGSDSWLGVREMRVD